MDNTVTDNTVTENTVTHSKKTVLPTSHALNSHKTVNKNSAYRKRRERADADPRVKTLITAFVGKYLTRVGTRYAVVSGKDPALLKGLLTAGQDVPAIEAAMDCYFANAFYSKTGFDVGGFAKSFNRLNSAGKKRQHDYDAGKFPELP